MAGRADTALGNLLRLMLVLLPWPLRRRVLSRAFGYELHPTSYIGRSWVYPRRHLRLGPAAFIGHGTVIRDLDDVELSEHAQIGALNWITGRSRDVPSPFFLQEPDRRSALRLGRHSTVTARHYLDCTNEVRIGAYSTLSGIRSVLMTHEIDVRLGRQVSRPIGIGDRCYVGTGCTLLPGAVLPDRCVVAAGSLVRGELSTSERVYAGTPARSVTELPADARYFTRERGVVE